MAAVNINLNELRTFFTRIRQAADGELNKALALFLEGCGFEFLRLVEDEIIRRKVMDTRLLLASFHRGADDNVWELDEDSLTLEVGSNVKYAAYVNDGHWTNPKGVSTRFVPGRWDGDRFIYEPGAKTGMVLKQKWVEGAHYWESAIRIFEKIFPKSLDAMLQNWLEKYINNSR